jgi:hypothetical protein
MILLLTALLMLSGVAVGEFFVLPLVLVLLVLVQP